MAECVASLYRYFTEYHCRYCTLRYSKNWYNKEKKQCFFCYHFHSVYHTKEYILKKISWHYDASQQKDKCRFYEEYLDVLRIWCEHYGIETTEDSCKLERELEEEIFCLKYPST